MTSNAKARQSVTSRIRQAVRDVLTASQVPSVVYGTVTAIAGSRLSVKQQGSTTVTPNLRYLASYTPTVGDTVICLNVSGDLWVLGKHA
ncbi:MAG: hypothetical protein KGH75_00145 [Rhodospirillales bacterium]|nr:hypothetical protein [Rhodospirillales bacterium]